MGQYLYFHIPYFVRLLHRGGFIALFIISGGSQSSVVWVLLPQLYRNPDLAAS